MRNAVPQSRPVPRGTRRGRAAAALAVLTLCVVPAGAGAAPCGAHAYIHFYAVPDLEKTARFLDTAADYARGPSGQRASPWNKTGGRFASLDFCPARANDRLVRLIRIDRPALAASRIAAGMLTVHSADLAASRAAAVPLAKGPVHAGTRKGRRTLWFEDSYGNTFIVLETR